MEITLKYSRTQAWQKINKLQFQLILVTLGIFQNKPLDGYCFLPFVLPSSQPPSLGCMLHIRVETLASDQ